MDFPDCRYYSLSRKLLLLIGQWPFQSSTERIVRSIFVLSVMLSAISTQVAKVVVSQYDVRLVIEVVVLGITVTICVIKFLTFHIQTKKIKLLLDTIESDWNSLSDVGDRKIAGDFAEEGRKYNFWVVVLFYSTLFFVSIVFGLQPLFIAINPTNSTQAKVLLYPAEYFVDPDKYFYPILLHMIICTLVAVTIVLATDTTYIFFVYHACGMFKIVSHRLEHVFDKCNLDETDTYNINSKTCMRIANAVKYHYSTIKYTDIIISTFEVQLFIVVALVSCNISLGLFCMILSLGKFNKMLAYFLLSISFMAQVLIVVYPCQKVVDISSAISFNAYCGQWYTAPLKIQTLLLPIIQRGANPTVFSIAKVIMITFENYAAAIQLSLSYFTVLLSFN